jgi:RNA polymerase sigma-70 factor (ECF subfamily)
LELVEIGAASRLWLEIGAQRRHYNIWIKALPILFGTFLFETRGPPAQYKECDPGWRVQRPTADGRRIRRGDAAIMEDSDIRRQLEARQYSEAFGLLLERFKEKVFRLAYSILRNETQAEDAAQDVFVRIWKGLPSYHGGASLSTWIYAIARNTCLTERTRRGRHPTVSLQEPEMEAAADFIPALQSADPAPGAEMDVETLLAQLPEKHRQVITLFYLEQKAYEEVASMLGLPLGTVKTLLFRAKKELLRISARQARTVPAETGLCQTNPELIPVAAAVSGLPKTRLSPRLILL